MSPTLSPEQKAAVATWLAAGDNLSAVQKKLREQFAVALTYMDVRFLVDDLNLQIKDAPKPAEKKADLAAPPPQTGPAGAPAAKKSLLDKAKEKLGLVKDAPADADELAEEDFADEPAAPPTDGAGNVSVTVDHVTLIPGAIASGGVTFSDGVTGQWVVDQHGRPGFTKVSQPGYRPSAADAQAFMQELSRVMQKKGF